MLEGAQIRSLIVISKSEVLSSRARAERQFGNGTNLLHSPGKSAQQINIFKI